MAHTFKTPLMPAKFMRRYKRFFVDAENENGGTLIAHCTNTGSMKGLLEVGNTAYLLFHDDPKRKLKYSLEMIDTGSSLVGVNTSIPNSLTAENIVEGKIPELTGYKNLKREVKYGKEGKSRIDIFLSDHENGMPDAYVEIKNVTLKEGERALFPDAVTERGTKHLNELIDMVAKGQRAVMFYLVQRMDCKTFSVAEEIDPLYAQTLRQAVQKGVEVLAYKCHLTPESIEIDQKMEVKL